METDRDKNTAERTVRTGILHRHIAEAHKRAIGDNPELARQRRIDAAAAHGLDVDGELA